MLRVPTAARLRLTALPWPRPPARRRKPEYAPDAQRLEKLRMLRKGSVLVADNVICPGAPALLEYFGVTPWPGWNLECDADFLESKAQRKPVYESRRWSTRLLESSFEYRPDQPDAMTVSVYKLG